MKNGVEDENDLCEGCTKSTRISLRVQRKPGNH